MKTIFKYRLVIADRQQFSMPKGATILHVGSQGPELYIWAMHEIGAGSTERTFKIGGTGMVFDVEGLQYLGSAQTSEGFVWHVFEELP